MATEKTLKSAFPTINTESGKAVRWEIEVTFKDGDFERDYTYSKDVTDLNKEPSQFTKSDLLGYAPAVLDEVFAHHKEVSSPDYVPPTSTDNEFDIDSLSSGETRRD